MLPPNSKLVYSRFSRKFCYGFNLLEALEALLAAETPGWAYELALVCYWD